jgi:hypothetical protein
MRRCAIKWDENLLHDKWWRTSAWFRSHKEDRERPMLQYLLRDAPEEEIAEASSAMRAEDDQICIPFCGMRRDAACDISFPLCVDMALHRKAPRPQSRADLVEIVRGLNAIGQMSLPVYCRWGVGLEHMEERHLSLAAEGKRLYGWQDGFRQVRTVQWH